MTDQRTPFAAASRAQQPYSLDDPVKHTHDFATCMLFCTWEQTWKAIETAPDGGWAVLRCDAVVNDTRARERRPDRYEQPSRVHDLHQGAEKLSRCFDWLATARECNASAHNRYAYSLTMEEVQEAHDAMLRVNDLLEEVIHTIATRWLPAAFSVIRHLPASQQRAAVVDMHDQLNATLHFISRARACCENFEVESLRWLAGWGCLDLALLKVSALFKWAGELALGLDPSSEIGQALRERSARALAELDGATLGFMARLQCSVTKGIFHNDKLMPYSIRFAERTRGRTAELREYFADLDGAVKALNTKW